MYRSKMRFEGWFQDDPGHGPDEDCQSDDPDGRNPQDLQHHAFTGVSLRNCML